MYGLVILCWISNDTFKIPRQLFHPYNQIYVVYWEVKI